MCLALVSKLRHSRVESRRPLRTIRVPIMSLLVVYTESDVNSCYSPAKPAFLYAHALNIVLRIKGSFTEKGQEQLVPTFQPNTEIVGHFSYSTFEESTCYRLMQILLYAYW
ncbi:uncharacterized protein LOC116415927 isoform X2 [Nasonia vitripennis]|uniref:Uncharacterized protein n=1 Tax=Nasonia vitripennis TaxID=7425 RepID=A0A7M7PXX4_NASVI|nr:uncharacterized protein LOC116415927 isoform X2 [Nasonia vitripennis]